MKIKATIEVSIKINDKTTPEDAHDMAIQKLIDVCEGWLHGEHVPTVKISYHLDKENTDNKYLN